MHIHDLFRGGAHLQKEARQAFGRFQSEGQLYDWLRELDKVLIDLYGDDRDDEERREKAVMMVTETVGGLYLTAKGKATKGGAWHKRARGDWQLAACCGEYRVGAEHVIAGRLGRDDFFLDATHQRGVMAAVRQLAGDTAGYEGKHVDYNADVHPVFLAIASNDLEALTALKPAETPTHSSALIDFCDVVTASLVYLNDLPHDHKVSLRERLLALKAEK